MFSSTLALDGQDSKQLEVVCLHYSPTSTDKAYISKKGPTYP